MLKACLILLLACGGLAASAQDVGLADPPRYFVRIGGRALFNVKAEVDEDAQPGQRWGMFDNGFVLPDVGGRASGKTWNWGYEDNSQVVGGQLNMERLRGLPKPDSFSGDEPALGGEILVGAELGRFEIGKREVRFGVEVGYGYNNFSVDDNKRVTSAATLTVYPFDLGGVVPPRAPYSGTLDGPGPLIDLSPSGTNVFTSSAEGDFKREIESDLHLFKVGVWFEYPLTRRLNGALSLGYASVYADTQYTFSEQVSFNNPAITDIARTTHTIGGRDWQSGVYAQLRMQYEFFRHFAAYVGGDFQWNSDDEFNGENRTITLEFGSQFAASAGVIVRF